jgi:LmbE family N-acetylglucosaminyl deacetylase
MAQTNLFSTEAQNAGVIVAHPDDETLWAGALILALPRVDWFITTLCRAGDPDRAPKFAAALQCLHAHGNMGDLDDSPEQAPLPPDAVQETILANLPRRVFDLILTHGPAGEYTRHRRHEEACRAVVALWEAAKLTTRELWMFAYDDGGRQYLPRPRHDAPIRQTPADSLWLEKYRLITDIYGFSPDSWEARTTPRVEAFWRFDSPRLARRWLEEWETIP